MLLLALLCVLLSAAPSFADPAVEADAAGAAFGGGEHVYVSPQAGQQLDAAKIADQIGDDPTYVAVVAPNNSPSDVLTQLQNSLQMKGTFVVISGTEQRAQSNIICSDRAQPLLEEAAKDEAGSRVNGDLTAFVSGYLDKVDDAPDSGSSDCEAGGDGGPGALSTLVWILGAVLLGAGGGYLWLRSRQRRRESERSAARQKVVAALDDLARDIDSVGDGNDAQTRQALEDARGRHIAAADLLADADTSADFDAAMRAVREGDFAAQWARERAGLRASTPRQVERPRGERLQGDRRIVIGDEQVHAFAQYRPGAPYYYAGNDELPAGWYTAAVGEDGFLASMSEGE